MRSLRKRALVGLAAVVIAVAMAQSMAFAGLINEYGMSFAGQDKCLECHDGTYGQTIHGRFATAGLTPSAPTSWTVFRAAGDPPVVAGTSPALFKSGGSYPVAGTWITLGDYAGGSATEYIFWPGLATLGTNPWNITEGLGALSAHGGYVVGSANNTGLYDDVYSCQRCHMLGTTIKTANATDTAVVPNPTVSKPATYTTPPQWARSEGTSAGAFNNDPTVSYPGMSIQCEACHGTGFKSTTNTTKHWNSGTQLSHRIPAGTTTTGGVLPATTVSTLLDSEGCGQCHGSYTNVAGTLGIYGYTSNLPLRNFVNIDGVPSGSYAYTKIPTEAQFNAEPTKYWMFPNGSNAKGSHYYYDEWAASSHSYRGALTSSSPDAVTYQKTGAGHYNAKTSDLGCAKCHTGEAYLKSKNAAIMDKFTPTNSNTGFSGQECVTCHNPHPSGSGTPDTIRVADAAHDTREPSLATANASVCEDCHNWQNEVLGTTPVYAPVANIVTSRGGPSHPTRETYHGRVMAEIPAGSDFMPGVKCEECHMVMTNKAANRVSHGMKIMLPGKAASWNATAGAAYVGQDSCSGCHPGETRSELQADIDKWQTDAAAEATKVVSAVNLAQTNAEYSLTNTAKPGYSLVGKATFNYKAYTGEGSMGAHNPPYILAGLKKATQLALSVGGTFNGMGASVSILPGNLAFVSGQVLNGDGTGATGAALTLLNGITPAGTAVSDANGNFAFMVAPGSTTTYHVKWARSSDAIADLMSANQTITVAQTSHTVTSSASGAGIVTPAGAQVVAYGDDQGFVFTPTTGYHVSNVVVDSGSIGTPSLYTFSNVTADHTVAVTFAINTYSLTYSAGGGGMVTGTSPQTVSYNGSGSAVTAVANSGYTFVNWSDASTANPRTDANVTADKSVTANFAAIGLPLARTGFAVQGSGVDYVRVKWTNPVGGGPVSYLKYQNSRTGAAGSWSVGATLPPNTTVYTNGGLRSKTKYYLRILAVNGNGTVSSPVISWTTK
jgi:hypothetical protein